MKMRDFKKYLEQFDDDVVVEVVIEVRDRWDSYTRIKEFEESLATYTDLTNNPHYLKAVDKEVYGHPKTLLLGDA